MKRLLFLFCTALFMWSCSSNEGEEPEPEPTEPKEYIISIGMAGEILEIEESPLSKASGNDLYCVQVYSKTSTTEYAPYAYGLFDDKSLMNIKLLEGYNYKFKVSMIVDGKYKIWNDVGHYGSPFPIILKNRFELDNNETLNMLDYGHATLNNGTYSRPNCDRFYGEITDVLPGDNKTILINMKRVVFGAKFIAEGLSEGTLKINMKDAPELNIVSGQTEIADIFTFENSLFGGLAWAQDNYSETVPVTIYWEKADGAMVPLINKDITFKRNVLTTITIKVKDTSMNNNINITQESGDMINGENIILESGTGLEGNVEPSAT